MQPGNLNGPCVRVSVAVFFLCLILRLRLGRALGPWWLWCLTFWSQSESKWIQSEFQWVQVSPSESRGGLVWFSFYIRWFFNDFQWCRTPAFFAILNYVSPCESKWVPVSPCESEWVQVSPCESKRVSVSPCESKWVHVSPSESKWVRVSTSESNVNLMWVQGESNVHQWSLQLASPVTSESNVNPMWI